MSHASSYEGNLSKPKVGCFYTTNLNYLAPTLVSASQLRVNTDVRHVAVTIIYLGLRSRFVDLAIEYARANRIELIVSDQNVLQGRHITYARFALHHLSDLDFDEVVYIDGDTQVDGSMGQYFDIKMDNDLLMATPDPMTLRINEDTPFWREKKRYFSSSGLNESEIQGYFNAGVIRATRANWVELSNAAVSYYMKRSREFRFSDQDILNLLVGTRYQRVSFKWNFPAFLIGTPIESMVEPKIYHFMSNPRPWHGPLPPWRQKWFEPYKTFKKEFPELYSTVNNITARKSAKYFLQQHYKLVFERRGWMTELVRGKLAEFEQKL